MQILKECINRLENVEIFNKYEFKSNLKSTRSNVASTMSSILIKINLDNYNINLIILLLKIHGNGLST